MSSLDAWLKSGKYLPAFMRDFHDQKDLFKAIHETCKPTGDNDIMHKVDWVTAHIYVIDVFLWFMARRGYTLQPARKKQDYVDLQETIKKCTNKRDDEFRAALLQGLRKP